jgi:adenine-specific DNA-methyltransferase
MPINKEDAKKFGINIIDSENNLQNAKQEATEAIKKLLPDLILDNKLNLEKLEELIGLSNTTYKNQGYELNFAGKALARAKADEETDFELKLEEKQSKNIENTENIVIKGDNIDVLKILKQNYEGKIKMIYIDPPYNTGNDGFVYNDNFKDSEKDLIEKFGLSEDSINFLDSIYKTKTHSGWLSFIYPRLKLAKDLLKEDGVIFISIDDNEQANLKILCDEIFGEENFVGNIIWKRKRGRDNSAKWFSKSHEYLLVYSRSKDLFRVSFLDLDEGTKKAYKNQDNDIRGDYRMLACWARGTQGGVKYDFTDKSGKYFNERLWLFSKDNLTKLDNEDKLIIRGENIYRKLFIFDNKGKIPETLWDNVSNAANATDEIKNLFGDITFDTPKPIPYIKEMLKISTSSTDLILDFFAGSGTTGHAVMDLNKEDGGNRKFILAQWDEKIDEKHEAYKFCKENSLDPVISSITIERLNRAGEKIKNELEEAKELDIGYKVFSLKEKIKLSEQNGQYIAINTYASDMDILYNMIAKTDVELHEKIEKVTSNLYKVKNSYYIISNIDEKDKEIISNIKNNIDNIFINGFADINLENLLNLLNTNRFTKDNVKIIY